jgi:ankyrin repeat protein
LAAAGADVNAKADTGATALMLAAGAGKTEVVQTLLSNGADVNTRANGKTALMLAEEKGHTVIVQLIRSRRR